MDESNNFSFTQKDNLVRKGLDLHMNTKRSRNLIKWGIFHAIITIALYIHMSNKCPYRFSKWDNVEYGAVVVFGINTIVYLIKYCYMIYKMKPVHGTPAQRRLLKFDETDKSFVVNPPFTPTKDNSTMAMNATISSWHSSFNDSNRKLNTSYSWYQLPRLSSSPNRTSLSSSAQNTSFLASPGQTFSSPYKKYSENDIIKNGKDLQQFLRSEEAKQENISENLGVQNTYNTSSVSPIWNYYNTAPNLLKASLYQLSPSEVSPNKQGKKEESGMLFASTDLDGNSEIIKKISPEKLSEYVANLRMWASSTILKRLELEINKVNAAVKTRGFSDIQIGNVGLERLKKTAENQQFVAMHVPTLPLLVPFLEMSTNQEYLVQRIRALAKGSCIAEYRWSSSSGDEHLPTDAAILFHLFCTYLDSQLMPLPQPGGRPFFNRYVVIGDKTAKEIEAKNKSHCVILCTNQLKPRFNFFSEEKIHNCTYDRNNLFYVIIQFLIHMKKHHEGLLEGVNLGKSGINILCVIED